MVETAADRLALLSDFGVCARYTYADGRTRSIKVIFDNRYYQQESGGTVGAAILDPRFVCRTADIPGAAEGDQVRIDGTTYTVRIVMPDGTGMSEAQLEIAA